MGLAQIQRVGLRRIVIVAALSALGVLVIAADRASAEPAICFEYPALPQCSQPAGGGDIESGFDPIGGDAQGGIPDAGGPSAPVGGGASGALPFTGYPLTPIVLLLLALLAAGLAIRGYLAVRERARARDAR